MLNFFSGHNGRNSAIEDHPSTMGHLKTHVSVPVPFLGFWMNLLTFTSNQEGRKPYEPNAELVTDSHLNFQCKGSRKSPINLHFFPYIAKLIETKKLDLKFPSD